MRDRVLSLGLALLALLLFAGLFIKPEPHVEQTMPSSEDRYEQGLATFDAWLRARGLSVGSWRKRWFELGTHPGVGHVLISHAPYRVQNRKTRAWSNAEHAYLEDRERDGLRAWVAKGNTVVLALSQLDPDHARLRGRRQLTAAADLAALSEIFGWELRGNTGNRKRARPDTTDPAARAQALHRLQLELPGMDAALESEHLAWDAQSASTLRYTPVQDDESCLAAQFGKPIKKAKRAEPGESTREPPCSTLKQALPILRSARDGSAVGWWLPFGHGHVVVLSYGGLFRNGELARGENAWLGERLLRYFLASEGRVLFDDYRYGLSEVYDPKALFRDPRLYWTLLICAGFWLLYAVGRSHRMLPIRTPPRRISSASFALGLSDFYARQLDDKQLAEALSGHFFERVRRVLGVSGEPALIWARLARDARLPVAEVERAQSLVLSGTDNVQLAQLLQHLARQLT